MACFCFYELRYVEIQVTREPQICINILQVSYLLFTSYHIMLPWISTPPPPAKDGDKFRSIFSDNLQPIATRGKKAGGTLLVDQHCGNGCSIKRAPLSVSYYNEISGGHIGRGVVRRKCSADPVQPLCGRQLLVALLHSSDKPGEQ